MISSFNGSAFNCKISLNDLEMEFLTAACELEPMYQRFRDISQGSRNRETVRATPEFMNEIMDILKEYRYQIYASAVRRRGFDPVQDGPDCKISIYVDRFESRDGKIIFVDFWVNHPPVVDDQLIKKAKLGFFNETKEANQQIIDHLLTLDTFNFRNTASRYPKVFEIMKKDSIVRISIQDKIHFGTYHGHCVPSLIAKSGLKVHYKKIDVTHNSVVFDIHSHHSFEV